MNCYDYNGTQVSYAEMLLIERFTNQDTIAFFNQVSGPKATKLEALTLQNQKIAVKLAQEINASIQKLISENPNKQSAARSCLGFNSILAMFQLDTLGMIEEANDLHNNIWSAIKMIQQKDNTPDDIGFLRGLVFQVAQQLWTKEAKTTEEAAAGSECLLGISAFHRLIQERSTKSEANASADQGVWSLTDDIMSGRPELAYLVFAGLDAALVMQQQAVWEYYQMYYQPMVIPNEPAQLPVENNEFASTDGVYELATSPLAGAAQPLAVV